MEFEDLVENRRAYKSFKDEEVEMDKLERIFGFTTEAPAAFNLHSYSFKCWCLIRPRVWLRIL